MTWVPVAVLLPADSPRLSGVDEDHVLALAKSEAGLPPILVHRESMRVIDGMHRLRAAVLRNQESIEALFFDGSPDEAFIVAVRVNIQHGLPLSLADREAAAIRIIAAFPDRSDGLIADATGLAARTVAALRHRTSAHVPQATARIGRDGRVRPLSSAEGRRAAGQTIARYPGASLREIARMTGISPTTVRDVRERIRRGEDPVPAGRRTQADPQIRLSSGGRSDAGTGIPAGRDRRSLLERLRRDPSLRGTESGRSLLRFLIEHTRVPQDATVIMSGVPPHSAYIVAELARHCADEWLSLALQLERRLHSMDRTDGHLSSDVR